MPRRVLVTGFPSSLLARRVLRKVVSDEPDAQVLALVSRALREQAAEAVSALPEGQRVELLAGELTDMDFGLSGKRFAELAATVDVIHHCEHVGYAGARRELAEKINVTGTGEVLELAEASSKLSQLVIWSSALIAGTGRGRVYEGELPMPESFPSVVEETRFRAEAMVREVMDHVPTTILRPSIVVGDSKTGEIDRLDGPYLLVQLLLSSPVDLRVPLPGRGDVLLNLVPIDWVVEAGHAISRDARSVGRTFHLVDERPLTARRVFELIAEACGRPGPVGSLPTQLASALLFTPGLERFSQMPRAFLEQLSSHVSYDDRNTRELLAGTGISCPPASSYITTMVDYVRSEQQKRIAERVRPGKKPDEVAENDDPLS